MRSTGLVRVGLGLLLAGPAAATDVSPADANLRYIGRWDGSSPAQPWSQAQGSSVVASFTGTSISATLNVSSGEYFRAIVDGDAAGSSKVSFSSGVPLAIATGLAPGTHSLELYKETDEGRATLLGFTIDDGESLVATPPGPTRRIVFYGDSNLAGYSLESERNLGGSDLVGSYYGYAGITARMFDAEHHNISRSGATISSLNTSFDRIDWTSNSPAWSFASAPADVVVVNIGANDYFRPKNTNKSRYHSLLDDLRAAHPLAHIMLFNAYGWESSEPASYTHEVVAERADPNLSSAVFPWVFEQFHGCQTDHAGMAQALAAHLASVTGWTPLPPDVVSGYGQHGDVANGGFEDAAPFGGWGWRYFDDPGVSRPFDPAGAHHGSHYLHLTGEASSHQTNPASGGDLIELSMWLRGANAGDTVDVTIGFRDQDGGGEPNAPMEQITETMTLSTSWQRHSLTVTAPTDTPDPVYSARVTFTAGPGAAVDVDDVAIGAPAQVPLATWAGGVLAAALAGAGLRASRRARRVL